MSGRGTREGARTALSGPAALLGAQPGSEEGARVEDGNSGPSPEERKERYGGANAWIIPPVPKWLTPPKLFGTTNLKWGNMSLLPKRDLFSAAN